MMRAVRNLLLATAAMAALPGCAAMATSPVSGFLYTDVSGPMTATSNSASRLCCSSTNRTRVASMPPDVRAQRGDGVTLR